MQNSSIVTRCPQCQTAFRVTHAQLNIAKGAVRCGSCLNIFRAMDHSDTPKDEPQKSTTKKANATASTLGATVANHSAIKTKPTKTDQLFTLDIDEELLQDNETLDNEVIQASDDFYFYDKETPSATKNTSIFGSTATKPVTENTQEKADESWALDILAELEDDDEEPLSLNLSKNKPAQTIEPELDSLEITEVIEPTVPELETAPSQDTLNTTEFEEAVDFAPTNDMPEHSIGYEELSNEESLNEPSLNAEPNKTSAEDEDLEFYFDENFEASTQHNDAALSTKKTLTEGFDNDLESLISDEEIDHANDTTPNYKQELQGMIKGIQSAPVEMGAYESEERRKWLWRIALFIVALLLAAQIIYFRFDTLGKHPSYRPILAQVCRITGCQMPDLVAIDKIRSNNLIVRSHPTADNALLVDVILINNANFEQPYPALSLEFSTLGNSLLAASEIQPSQYLRGELAGSHLMPVKQPIQVSLSIQDPGSNAVNYQLNIFGADISK